MNVRGRTLRMILAALFFAIAYVLPFLTGQIREFGAMLCPMHLPVLLCGFLCGKKWGVTVGATLPLFRSLTLGMPLLFPSAVCMAFELATYAAVAGGMYKALPRKRGFVYVALFTAMLAGRAVWGIAMFVCLGITGSGFTFAAFLAGAFTNAALGIFLQILLVPLLVILLDNPKILHLSDVPATDRVGKNATH